MTVGLKVDFLWYPIGNGGFVHSFFSTIAGNLEKNKWGNRFPIIMNELYQGKLKYENLQKGKQELITIHKELESYKPSDIIWDIDDFTKEPPWGNNISKNVINLSNYFVTSDGRDLFEVLYDAISEAENEHLDIEIKSL